MVALKILVESAFFAVSSLVANRLRTLLSILGVVIGIFVIILINTAVDAIKRDVDESISSLGDDVVFVHKWPWEFSDFGNYPWWKYVQRPQPKINEVDEVMERSEMVDGVTFRVVTNRSVRYGNNNIPNAEINGVGQTYDQVQNIELGDGRFFTESEIRNGSNVAVIGADIASGLFESGDPIDRVFKIKGKRFSIIGTLKKEGQSLIGNGNDEKIYVPFNSIRNIVDLNNWRVHQEIIIKGKAGIGKEELKGELTGIMRSIRKLKPFEEDDFSLNEPSMIANSLAPTRTALTVIGGIIGGLALLVGLFGIANIMFVSVKERTNIIGIQKALGAKRSFILMQFLIEAVILSLIGGIFGIFLVFLTSLATRLLLDFNMVLSAGNILQGIIFSSVAGVIAGIAPAILASKLDPVEAIRAK